MNGLPAQAIALIVFGLFLAACNGALMKLSAETLPLALVVWFRYAGYLLMMLPIVLWRNGSEMLSVSQPGLQVMRGLFMAGSGFCFIAGAQTLDYADAIAILYAYPFMVTLLAPWLLAERVSAATWIGVATGFIGVLVVARPSFDGIGVDALWVLLCACLVTAQLLLNRKLGTVTDPLVTSTLGALSGTVAISLALPWIWQPPPPEIWGILCLMGVTGAISQTAVVLAFSKTQASDLAPFTYSEIVAAVVVGWLVFGTLPDAVSWAGIALIIASGVAVARAMAMRTLSRQAPKV